MAAADAPHPASAGPAPFAAPADLSLQALRRSESRYRRLFETARDGILILNADTGQIEDVNPYLIEMLGYSHAEFLGKKLWEVGTFADIPHSKELFHELQAKGYVRYDDLPLRTSAGARVQVEFVSNSYDCEGIKVIQCNVRDITERKHAEGAVLREKAFTDAALDSLPGLFYLIDERGRFLRWNRNFETVSGYSAEEISWMMPGDFFAGMEKAIVAGKIRQVFQAGAATLEADFVAKDRTRTPYLFTGTLVQMQQGPCLIGMGIDITVRKQAEHDLERFGRAMDVSPDSIYLTDPATMRFIYLNRTACQRLGYGRERLLQMGPQDVLAMDRDQIRLEYDAVIAAGELGLTHERQFVTSDGSEGWTELHRRALRTEGGTVIVTIGRDITGRKQADESIRRLNRVYAVLSGINSAIVRIGERSELFRETCRIAVSEGGFALARVIEVDSAGTARIAATSESDARLFQQIVDDYNGDPANSSSLLATALRSMQPMISNDVASDARVPNRAALTKDGNYALALLPIVLEERIAGVVILRALEAGMFDEAERQLLLELVSNLAFALGHIEKEKKVQRLTRVYAVLSGINSLIVRVHNRDELFHEACRIAVEQAGFPLAWIGMFDSATQDLRAVAMAGTVPEYAKLLKPSVREDIPAGRGTNGRAFREGTPIVVNDMAANPDEGFMRREGLALGIRAAVSLPLQADGVPVGVISLYAREKDYFDAEEMKLLTELAGDISFAIRQISKQERLDYLAYYNELTGLANRTLFLDRVTQHLRSAAGGGHRLALFFLDLERFRNINDSLGRPAGDALLKQVAEWLSREVGDPHLLAHLGADHFAVVLPVLKQDGDVARLVEEKIRALLDHPFQLKDTEYRVAVRVGVALFPKDGTDADTLLRNAEAALKKAKARGEPYLFYKSKMTAKVAGKLSLENQLRNALANEEFVLHYQPKVNLLSGKLTGAEGLIRWNDPQTGLVSPGRFIPVLEETGLIFEVGRWALRTAIHDYLRWRAAGLPAMRIAVNVSPLQLRNRGFVAEIRQKVEIDPHAAAGLELEITESLIMEDVKHSIASLQAIRAMGVSVAIDDFGTGFSSLSYLAKLPVDTLKIDRSFVVDMTVGPQGLALVSTIISLAHSLNLKAVAEGVETGEQSRLLRLLKCDEFQGFLFCKPVPGDVFEAKFLAAGAAVPAAQPSITG